MSGDERNLTNSLEQTLGLYEHLGEESSLILEPGIDQDEVFDSQFERRAHEIQRTPGAADAIPVIPAKRGPWTGNNQLGIQRKFAPDNNNRQTILKLDEWGFPETWTLALGLDFDHTQWNPQGGLTASFDVTAVIDFGVGGVIQQVEIDWVNGTAIVLPMNALNVVAQYNLDVANEAFGDSQPPLDLKLRASLGRGVLTQTQPTRTYRLATDDDGEAAVDLPPFARFLTLLPTNTDENGVFNFFNQPGTIVFDTGTVLTPGLGRVTYTWKQFVEYLSLAESTCGRPVKVPVPTGARSVAFSGDPGGPVDFFVQFEIGV
jgi:hypothetical protein